MRAKENPAPLGKALAPPLIGLKKYLAAGELLLKDEAGCGPRKFAPWVKQSLRFTRRTAYHYMRVAAGWSVCKTAFHLRDALRCWPATAVAAPRATWR